MEETEEVIPGTLGRIASFYYLHYTTMKLFYDSINDANDLNSLLQVLCDAGEYDELPVRHNEVPFSSLCISFIHFLKYKIVG